MVSRGGVGLDDLIGMGIPAGVALAELNRLVAEGRLTDEGEGGYGPVNPGDSPP
jgi:hypothetical protein